MAKMLRIVAFTGPKTCGKDTAADALLALNSSAGRQLFERRQMADPAKTIASIAFGFPRNWADDQDRKEEPLSWWPNLCPRQLTIDVANWYRDKYTGEVWARKWERDALHSDVPCQIIPDLRFPEELEMLRRHHSLIVYVQRDSAEKALREAQAGGDEMAKNVSESHYDMLRKIANCRIDNNGPIHDLRNHVYAVVRNCFGHWSNWNIQQEVA
jgi:hypothetical protein